MGDKDIGRKMAKGWVVAIGARLKGRWMVVKGRIEINWENGSKRLDDDKRIKTDEVG